MPSPRFSVISEGATDFAVLNRLLIGFFDDSDITVNALQPNPAAAPHSPDSFGGWEKVLEYLASSRFEAAFPFTDFVIVHIDTDVCQEAKFGVATHDQGEPLAPRILALRVIENLKVRIGAEVWQRVGDRVLFAVAVDSIECWLLLLYTATPKNERYQNCLPHLNSVLVKKNEKPLGEGKVSREYERAAKPFGKPKELAKVRGRHESLELFLEALEQSETPEAEPVPPLVAAEPD